MGFEQLSDGIYFNLDEDLYHGQNRLSSSGCGSLMVSPGTFWKDSWFDLDRKEPEEIEAEGETPARITGKAYHAARLEPSKFRKIYTPKPDISDYEKPVITGTHIKAELKELGQAQTKTGEVVLEAAYRLRDAGYPGPIWPIILDEWERSLEDYQIGLAPDLYKEISIDMSRLYDNPEILPFLSDGQPEVTVMWTDERGVQWKARLDYLRLNGITDLKTFDNAMRKNLEKCIVDATQYNRYYIQAAVYWTAAEIIRNGTFDGAVLPIKKIQNQAQKDLIEAIRKSDDPFEYWWIFQEKKGIPNVLARRLRMTREVHPHYLAQAPNQESRDLLKKKIKNKTQIWEKALLEMEHCRNLFIQCQEIWPDRPWGPMIAVADIDDESFSTYFLES